MRLCAACVRLALVWGWASSRNGRRSPRRIASPTRLRRSSRLASQKRCATSCSRRTSSHSRSTKPTLLPYELLVKAKRSNGAPLAPDFWLITADRTKKAMQAFRRQKEVEWAKPTLQLLVDSSVGRCAPWARVLSFACRCLQVVRSGATEIQEVRAHVLLLHMTSHGQMGCSCTAHGGGQLGAGWMPVL